MSATLATRHDTMSAHVIATAGAIASLGADHRLLLSAACAIRGAMPLLDRFEAMTVDAILAYGVHLWEGDRALCDDAWARMSSPFSLRGRPTAGVEATTQAACDAVHARLDEYAAARQASQDGTASRRLDELMKEQAALHPRLGLSFGYIGNCGFGGYDDRSWKIFAKLATRQCHGACDVSFGGVPTSQLGKLMQRAEREFAAWCDQQERLLDAEEIRIVGPGG